MKAFNALLIPVTLLISISVHAQDVPEVLRMDDAIAIAMEKNFDIMLAENNSEILVNNAVKANAGYLPTVNLSGSYNYQNQNTYSEFAGNQIPPIDVKGAETQTINAGVTVNYSVYSGGRRKYSYERLQYQAQIGELREKQQMETTVNAVIRQYLTALNFHNAWLIRQESIELSYDRFMRVRDNYNYGNISKLELLNAQVDLSNDSSEYIQASINLKKAKNELNNLMGLSPEIEYELDTNLTIDKSLEMQPFLDKAMSENSQYLIQKASRESSMQDLKINNAQRFPNLSISGGYNYARQDFEASFIRQSENLGWNAGVTLSYNIFDGNRVNRNEQNAKIQLENEELTARKLEVSIQKDIYNAYEDYQAGISLLQLRKNNMDLAQANYERSVEAYSLGQITGIQLREAQINLLNAKYALTLQKIQAKNAEANLYLLSGTIIDN